MVKSDSRFEDWRCPHYGTSCNWRVHAYQNARSTHWKITKYFGPHTCVSSSLTQDHLKLDSDVIASHIVSMVTEKPDVFITQIIERMRSIF